jgi:mRNA interferase RelE/StbE
VPWAYSFDERALQELQKLDRQAQRQIVAYLEKRIATKEDPRRFGKPLRAQLVGLWRNRVRDYRILCQIKDDVLLVLVVSVGHLVESGAVRIVDLLPEHVPDLRALSAKYPEMDFCDTAMVRLAEIFPKAKVVTTESGHFTVYRKFRDKPLNLVHPGV